MNSDRSWRRFVNHNASGPFYYHGEVAGGYSQQPYYVPGPPPQCWGPPATQEYPMVYGMAVQTPPFYHQPPPNVGVFVYPPVGPVSHHLPPFPAPALLPPPVNRVVNYDWGHSSVPPFPTFGLDPDSVPADSFCTCSSSPPSLAAVPSQPAADSQDGNYSQTAGCDFNESGHSSSSSGLGVATRRSLPHWIKEGLKKMEKEKWKKLEKNAEDSAIGEASSSCKQEETQSLETVTLPKQGTSDCVPAKKSVASWTDSVNGSNAGATVGSSTNRPNAVSAVVGPNTRCVKTSLVRELATRILMEVTTGKVQSIAAKVMNEVLTRDATVVELRESSSLNELKRSFLSSDSAEGSVNTGEDDGSGDDEVAAGLLLSTAAIGLAAPRASSTCLKSKPSRQQSKAAAITVANQPRQGEARRVFPVCVRKATTTTPAIRKQNLDKNPPPVSKDSQGGRSAKARLKSRNRQ